MNFDTLLVIGIIGIAAGYLIYRYVISKKGGCECGCDSGCSGCGTSNDKQMSNKK